MSNPLPNPYLGPQAFEREQHTLFFGRTKEARDLMSLILSERITLFYAPSGAGKSSLLNTSIVPGLEANGFAIRATRARIGQALPEDADFEKPSNIFVFNLLNDMDGGETDFAVLAELTIQEYLAQSATTSAKQPRIIVIDQFEEIITTHLSHWQEREAIFSPIGRGGGCRSPLMGFGSTA